jgi:hypothetical protein
MDLICIRTILSCFAKQFGLLADNITKSSSLLFLIMISTRMKGTIITEHELILVITDY